MRRGCRIRDFIHAAWLTHGGYVIDSWPARREATADRNPPIDHDLYHEFIEEIEDRDRESGAIRNHQPARVSRRQGLVVGQSNNVSLGGHLEINLTQQLQRPLPLGHGSLRSKSKRETMTLCNNMFDSTPARNNHGLRISGERSCGKKQFQTETWGWEPPIFLACMNLLHSPRAPLGWCLVGPGKRRYHLQAWGLLPLTQTIDKDWLELGSD